MGVKTKKSIPEGDTIDTFLVGLEFDEKITDKSLERGTVAFFNRATDYSGWEAYGPNMFHTSMVSRVEGALLYVKKVLDHAYVSGYLDNGNGNVKTVEKWQNLCNKLESELHDIENSNRKVPNKRYRANKNTKGYCPAEERGGHKSHEYLSTCSLSTILQHVDPEYGMEILEAHRKSGMSLKAMRYYKTLIKN